MAVFDFSEAEMGCVGVCVFSVCYILLERAETQFTEWGGVITTPSNNFHHHAQKHQGEIASGILKFILSPHLSEKKFRTYHLHLGKGKLPTLGCWRGIIS